MANISSVSSAISDYSLINQVEPIPKPYNAYVLAYAGMGNISSRNFSEFVENFIAYNSAYKNPSTNTEYAYPLLDKTEEWSKLLDAEKTLCDNHIKILSKRDCALIIALVVYQLSLVAFLVIATIVVFPPAIMAYPVLVYVPLIFLMTKSKSLNRKISSIQDKSRLFLESLEVFKNSNFQKWLKKKQITKVNSLRELFTWVHAYSYDAPHDAAKPLLDKQKIQQTLTDLEKSGKEDSDEYRKALFEFGRCSREYDLYHNSVKANAVTILREQNKKIETVFEHFQNKIDNAKKMVVEAEKCAKITKIAQIIFAILSTTAVALIFTLAPSTAVTQIFVPIHYVTWNAAFVLFRFLDKKVIQENKNAVKVYEKQKEVCERAEFQAWLKDHKIVTIPANYLVYANLYLLEKDEKE